MSTKLTDLADLGVKPASGDFFTLVDVSDTTGGASGTSKKVQFSDMTGNLLSQVETTVTNGDVLTMKYDDTPIELVAGIAGKIIVPIGITIVATAAGGTEPTGTNLHVGWDASVSLSGDYFVQLRNMMNGIASPNITSQSTTPYANGWGAAYGGDAVSKALEVWSTSDFTGGWSMKIYTTYYTITV